MTLIINGKTYEAGELIAYVEKLEKENKTVSRKANEAIADKLLITAKYNEVLNDLNQENDKLQKENAELKEYNKYLRRKRQGGIQKQYNKVAIIKQQDEQLTKAKKLLAKWVELFKPKVGNIPPTPIQVVTEQFLKNDCCPDVMCEDCTKEDCGIKKLGLVEVKK